MKELRKARLPARQLLAGIYYGGFDRMQWFDVDYQADARRALPEDLRLVWERAESYNYTGFSLVFSLSEARQLLAFSNRVSARNEIVALYSDTLASLVGTVSLPPAQFEWLGWDVAPLADISLLREGLFMWPELFGRFRTALNSAGLLASREITDSYAATYRALMEEGLVEEFVEQPYSVEAIRLGRVLTENVP